ncbi:MAG: hypothetical protein EPN94_00445 [Nitrospirae bacterium]|nr:MAG: hypothetical protein EPN94_00445 [Nitrospirota bacterium]
MSQRNMKLAYEYFERVMGKSLNQISPIPVSGREVVEIVWPLNDIFRPFLSRIRTIKYDQRFEKAADDAIEQYVIKQAPETWVKLAGETWRVLLERHQQLIVLALANEMQKNKVTLLPQGLPENARLGGIMFLLLHSMTLPWPPEDRSHFDLPEGGTPSSLTVH